MEQTHALGIDIGGTFTDVVVYDRATGQIAKGKELTTPDDPSRGVLTALEKLLEGGIPPESLYRIVHETTLFTNALIERKGARTGLITTKGFRDVLGMGRESRYDIYDVEMDLPEPLIPRALVFEVNERIDARGQIVTSLDDLEVAELARRLVTKGIDAVAVCLLHSFRDARHERAIAEVFSREAPGVSVSLSSDVSPDIGEFERASTTVANAYVRPIMRRYLDDLVSQLNAVGMSVSEPLIMTSDGGTIPLSLIHI